MDIINNLLKTGNKTANIIVKMQYIHTVNGDGWKNAEIIKTMPLFGFHIGLMVTRQHILG